MLIAPVAVILVAENLGHLKAVAGMTGRNMDPALGRAFVGDGLATMLSGSVGGSGVTTLCGEHWRHGGDQGLLDAGLCRRGADRDAARLLAEVWRINPHHSRPVIGGASIVVFGLIAGRRGADLGTKPRRPQPEQQFDHGVGDPGAGRRRFRAVAGRLYAGAELVRPPSGRSCCTRCFIAGRARRRRPG